MTTNGKPAASAFPLCWPPARPRTPAHQRERSDFHERRGGYMGRSPLSLGKARDELIAELARLRVSGVVLSTNIPLRRDGIPYADASQPKDPGVAVYFTRKGRQVCFAADRWTRVEDNMRAVAKTIEALRGIERWGTGDMIDAAFTGFAALPAATVTQRRWYEVLGVPADTPAADVETAYRKRAMEVHPDRGGTTNEMAEVNRAWEEFGGTPWTG